jgi:hypothetical protein
VARTPLASSVVAPTRSRPSLMVNGICAEADRKRAGRQRRFDDLLQPASSLACPLSLARTAASKARGSRPGDPGRFQRHGSAAGQRAGQRRGAAALARQRHLHRRAAGGHREVAIAQRRAVDAGELNARIQRNAVRARPGVDTGGDLAAADLALDGIEASATGRRS